jgi:para-nitrobenzyl esterase
MQLAQGQGVFLSKETHMPTLRLFFLLCCGLLALGACALDDPLRLDAGLVSGVAGEGVRIYRGIPFAAPPVGPLRWRAPQPVAPWAGVRACTAFGSWCPQPSPLLEKVVGAQSEDCLYLNVWTPAATAAERLPVMVWIHGGGLTTGSGASPNYEGSMLAREGMVVVTINYRLGPFGFFAHPLFSRESPHGVSGNYGLLDQIAALQWVQRNIAAFGGDPGCVTIFGESAGALSVAHLLATPLAAGLFHRAICESGASLGNERDLRRKVGIKEPMEAVGERIAQQLGCATAADPLAALRAKSAEELLAAADPAQGLFGNGTKFGFVADGWVFPHEPAELLAAGAVARVPVLLGTNADEGTIFLRQLPPVRATGYRLLVRRLFGEDADAALRLFPAPTDAEVPDALNKLITVTAFVGPTRTVARGMAAAGAPVFLYHFTRVPPHAGTQRTGACHGIEIPYIFGNPLLAARVSETDRTLSAAMRACWIRFAKTGDPNGAGIPAWPRYTAADARALYFGDTITVGAEPYGEACALLAKRKAEL